MSIIRQELLLNEYERFITRSKDERKRWEFGNEILYRMCRENPFHNDPDIIAGKIWLIGRSYAAAIERGRQNSTSKSGDDFYYEDVAPTIQGIGFKLDKMLKDPKLNGHCLEDETLKATLSLHGFLTSSFSKVNGKRTQRSLASKYLHFHRPDAFFIYDSRADESARKLSKFPSKEILSGISSDKTYGGFICRIVEIEKCLEDNTGSTMDPRELDNFLLWVHENSRRG